MSTNSEPVPPPIQDNPLPELTDPDLLETTSTPLDTPEPEPEPVPTSQEYMADTEIESESETETAPTTSESCYAESFGEYRSYFVGSLAILTFLGGVAYYFKR